MGHHNGRPRRTCVWIVGKLDLPLFDTGWRLHPHPDRGQRQHAHRNCDSACGPHAHAHADSNTYHDSNIYPTDTYHDSNIYPNSHTIDAPRRHHRLPRRRTATGWSDLTAAFSPSVSGVLWLDGTALQRPVVGITPTKGDLGYWLVACDGGIFTFGNAGFYGSIPGLGIAPAGSGLPHSLNAPIVGMVPSSDGNGYFMVGADGGVFTFGDAKFEGSCPSIGGCAGGAAVAVMPDATGNGYWVVTAGGDVQPFGDAAPYGGPGPAGRASRRSCAQRRWRWLLHPSRDGDVYAYGDAVNGGANGEVGGFNKNHRHAFVAAIFRHYLSLGAKVVQVKRRWHGHRATAL